MAVRDAYNKYSVGYQMPRRLTLEEKRERRADNLAYRVNNGLADKWYVFGVDDILHECNSLQEAKQFVIASNMDNRKRPVFKKASDGVYGYIPSRLTEQDGAGSRHSYPSYWIATRYTLTRTGGKEKLEEWEKAKQRDWLMDYCRAMDGVYEDNGKLLQEVEDQIKQDPELTDAIGSLHSRFDTHESFVLQLTQDRQNTL